MDVGGEAVGCDAEETGLDPEEGCGSFGWIERLNAS